MCEYHVALHAPKLAVEGISTEGALHLLDYKEHPELDDVDRLLAEYGIAVTQSWSHTRDEIFDRLKLHFTKAQIVQLT